MRTKLLFIGLFLAITITGCNIKPPVTLPEKEIDLGGRSATETILDYSFSSITHTSTSTSASANIKLLDSDADRQYALIENDSDTIVYVGLTSASSTVVANTGIRINASGGTYEIDQDNLYTGEVWMATTTASKNILITYY